MTTDSLLSLLQLSDSFFPTGMFAHSLGLEGMVGRGRIRAIEDVERFVVATLTHAVLPSDGVALLNAHRATASGSGDELVSIDRRLSVMKAAPELRLASQQHGRRLLTETEAFTEDQTLVAYRAAVLERTTPGMGAVALGAVSSALDIDSELALAGYIHGYTVSVVSAAIRVLPLSNTDCQLVIHRLHEAIREPLESIRGRTWRSMTGFTPDLDIASMGHVHDDLRMFAS